MHAKKEIETPFLRNKTIQEAQVAKSTKHMSGHTPTECKDAFERILSQGTSGIPSTTDDNSVNKGPGDQRFEAGLSVAAVISQKPHAPPLFG